MAHHNFQYGHLTDNVDRIESIESNDDPKLSEMLAKGSKIGDLITGINGTAYSQNSEGTLYLRTES